MALLFGETMFASLSLVGAFFKHPFGIFITIVVFLLGLLGFVEYMHIKDLNSTIATQNQALGQAKAISAQFQDAASACSTGTAALAASETAATVSAASAVAVASVKAKTYENHATAVLARKATGTDDYANSKQLMNELIDNRGNNQP